LTNGLTLHLGLRFAKELVSICALFSRALFQERGTDVAIDGFFGGGNAGDEAILTGEISALRREKPDVLIAVFSQSPKSTASSHDVISVTRGDLTATIPILLRTNLFILGGGGLIRPGFARSYGFMILIARILGSKTMIYAVSALPLRQWYDRFTAGLAVQLSEMVWTRDNMSEANLQAINQPGKIRVATDSAFSLEPEPMAAHELNNYRIPGSRYVVLCLKQWEHQDLEELRKHLTYDEFLKKLATVCDAVMEQEGVEVLAIPMQVSNSESDVPIAKNLRSRCMYYDKIHVIEDSVEVRDILALIQGAELTIGMRLHSVILSIISATPFVSLAYSPKVTGQLESLGLSRYIVDLEHFDEGVTSRMAVGLLHEAQQARTRLNSIAGVQRFKAQKLAKSAIQLLQS
jgi:polysaccharide pyruvyl transferase CsaB